MLNRRSAHRSHFTLTLGSLEAGGAVEAGGGWRGWVGVEG